MRGLNIYAALVAAVLVGLALAVAAEADEQPGATPTPPPAKIKVSAGFKRVDKECLKFFDDVKTCSKENLIEL